MSPTDLVAQCAALGDPTRWQILQLVGARPRSASALADEVPVSRQAIARHLEVLAAVGLVERRRVGVQVQYVALGAQLSALADALDAIGRGWDRRLASVKAEAERRDSAPIRQGESG